MNELELLIITDKGDKTNEILYYSMDESNSKVHVRYCNNPEKPYSFSVQNIIIRKNPRHVDIENKVVLHNGSLLQNVRHALVFDEFTKVLFVDGGSKLFETVLIAYADIKDNYRTLTDIMGHWREISKYIKSDDAQESFLEGQFVRLRSVESESVLAAYMEKKAVKQYPPSLIPAIYPFQFNLSQKKALELGLTHNMSIIQGPPGTGKTQTILNIIANLAIRLNKTVAVVSNNNTAVQNVRDKLMEKGYGFIAAALGKADNRNSFFKNLPDYSVADWECEHPEQIEEEVARIGLKLDRLLELANHRALLDRKIETYRTERKHFELHQRDLDYDRLEKLFYRRQTPEAIISFLADEYFTEGRALRFLQKSKLLFKYGFYQFKKLKHSRLTLISKMQMRFYDVTLEQLEAERVGIQAELEQESFADLIKMHQSLSSDLFKHHLYERYHKTTKFEGNEKNYRDNFEEFIRCFPVMLSTTHSLRSCIPDTFLFDYVIIDEASQVDLLTGALALSCCKNVIIVGDTKQLPQIVDEQIKQKLQNSDIDEDLDYFKHNILSSIISIYQETVPGTILKEHYRCHPKIIGFCNVQYYENQLIPYTSETDSDVPLRVHYTAKGNHFRKVTIEGKKGSFNQREIEAVREEILQELRMEHIPYEHIGFTTPYRMQVNEAEAMLGDEIEIDTVHRYQGREKSIMIMSTVLDQTRFGKQGMRFVENPNLVNVAVSRAQKQFILVTDHELFRKSRQDVGNLIRYMEYQSLHEHVTNSELISVFDLLYSQYSEKLHELHNRLASKSRFKSENIMWTLLEDILEEEAYQSVYFCTQIYLKDIFHHPDRFSHFKEAEQRYMRNRASFDFVLYDKLDKQPLLAIEVDGFASHRNNQAQIDRDKLKNNICHTYPFPLLRLPTTGSDEGRKIREMLDKVLTGTWTVADNG